MNHQEISFYEELQCNAFPALQNVMYDGWSVRFGGGFTYRVNCANAMYPEAAFYNVGTIDDVVEKAKKLEAGEL